MECTAIGAQQSLDDIIKHHNYIDTSYKEEIHKLNSASIYYEEIRKYPILTKEEEKALFIKYNQYNDKTAKNRIFKCNLRYVFKVSSKIYYNCRFNFSILSLEDLVQEGNIGLLIAIDKFDYTKDYRLLTYADQFIRQSIYRCIQNKDRLIRIPVHVEENYKKILKAKEFLNKFSREKITLEKLSKTSNLTLKETKKTLNSIKNIVYLDAKIDPHNSKQNKSDKTIKDIVEDKNTQDLMDLILEDNMQSERYSFLEKLNIEEMNLILQKYNNLEKIITDEELALLNNTSVDKIQSNLSRAKRKLRQNQKRPLY